MARYAINTCARRGENEKLRKRKTQWKPLSDPYIFSWLKQDRRWMYVLLPFRLFILHVNPPRVFRTVIKYECTKNKRRETIKTIRTPSQGTSFFARPVDTPPVDRDESPVIAVTNASNGVVRERNTMPYYCSPSGSAESNNIYTNNDFVYRVSRQLDRKAIVLFRTPAQRALCEYCARVKLVFILYIDWVFFFV